MGLFDFFRRTNSGSNGYSEGDKKIIIQLLGYRTLKYFESQGYTQTDASKMSLELLNQQDLSGNNILQAPEASIFKIIRDYIEGIDFNINTAKKKNILVNTPEISEFVISYIEKERNKLVGINDLPNFPLNIDDYVFYRVQREIPVFNKTSAENLGFTKEVVQSMVNIVKAAYDAQLNWKI